MMSDNIQQGNRWNNPFAGVANLIGQVVTVFKREKVPEEAIKLYSQRLRETKAKAWHVQRINLQKFDSEEFTYFLKIKVAIAKGTGKYQGLKKSIQLMQVALDVKDSFLLIEETEMRFRSITQQEYYNFIVKLLTKKVTEEQFRKLAHQRMEKTLPQIKSEKARTVMEDYLAALDVIASHQLGLKLLRMFKQSQLNNYTILRTVSEIAVGMRKQNLRSIKQLTVQVHSYYSIFENLGKIIGLPEQHNTAETYALILQFIGLRERHAKSYNEFKEFIRRLRDWEKAYLFLVNLRNDYLESGYWLPSQFHQPIPCEDIYEKYQDFLS